MHFAIPGIPLDKFDKAVLEAVIEIYREVTGLSKTDIPDEAANETDVIITRIHEPASVEYRIGSSFSPHSKLLLYSVMRWGGPWIVFDFDPNVANDSLEIAVATKKRFRERIHQYFHDNGYTE